MEKLTRKEYIEREFSKWQNNYEIGFEQEFDIKALLNLQYQFMITPNEHTKAQGDIIHTINQIRRNMNLKTKINHDKQLKVIVLTDDYGVKSDMYNLFYNLLQPHTITGNEHGRKLITKDFEVTFTSNPDLVRGMKSDYTIDLVKSSVNIK